MTVSEPPPKSLRRRRRVSELIDSDRTHTSERNRLFSSFGYMAATQGSTAVLGLVYWIVVTRSFSARDVGLAAAAASTAAFLAAIGALGVPILLLAEIGNVDPPRRRSLFTTGSVVTGLVVLVLALLTLALSPVLGKSLRVIGGDPTTAWLFVVGSVGTVAGITFDNAAIGLHKGSAQLLRGSLSSILKIVCVVALIVAGSRTSAGLLLAWALALAVALVAAIPVLRLGPRSARRNALREGWQLTRDYAGLSFKHHILNLSINSISYLVPLTAALLIRPQQVAYFTTAFLLSATVLILPYLLTLALFAEQTGDDGLLRRHIRRTFPFGLVLCTAIVVAVELTAPYVLRIFGPGYVAGGTTALRLLILVGPAYVVKDHYVVIRRAQGRLTHAARIMALGTLAEVAGSAVGAGLNGMIGLCVGWAIAASVEALILTPSVLQLLRRPTSTGVGDTAPR